MKFFKYVLIIIATIGLLGSIYNAFNKNTLEGFFEHLLNSTLLIIIAFNVKKIDRLYKALRS
jgi:hypothetical protein